MADTLHTPPSTVERFVGDYIHTFGRFLDPNLPASSLLSGSISSDDAARWSWGQTIAFASVSSMGLWALVASLIYFAA